METFVPDGLLGQALKVLAWLAGFALAGAHLWRALTHRPAAEGPVSRREHDGLTREVRDTRKRLHRLAGAQQATSTKVEVIASKLDGLGAALHDLAGQVADNTRAQLEQNALLRGRAGGA